MALGITISIDRLDEKAKKLSLYCIVKLIKEVVV